jgi:transposase
MDRLKPSDAVKGRGAGEMLRYHVLAGGYLEGMSTRQIMARYGISESTLHRYRRDGVRVLAQELGEQEARFSRDTPDAATG